MPAASGLTFLEASADVLARIGQLDDGVSNPLLVAEAKAHINAAQRQLQVEHAWLRQRRIARIAIADGQRFCDLPVDARHGQLRAVSWVEDTLRYPLMGGIDRGLQGATGIPERYQLSPSTGIASVAVSAGGTGYTNGAAVAISGGTRDADGHQPAATITVTSGVVTGVTITDSGSGWAAAPTLTAPGGTGATLVATLGPVQVVELWPTPSVGTIEAEYLAGVVKLTADTERLALDDEAVVGRAAFLLASSKSLRIAADILGAHTAYLRAARAQQGEGATVSLSGWRRDH